MSEVTKTRLKNGLSVVSEVMREAPVVALQAWVRVGSADEESPVLGVAHLHEHMLFKGTKRRGVGEIARTVESCGGEINAWTSFDQTVYHLVLPASQLAVGVDILADALSSSVFDKEELAREIEVVLEEIRRSEDSPGHRLANMVFANAFAAHPYQRPVIGYEHTVRAMTRSQILSFFERYYRPENITLVVVGDFSATHLQTCLEESFGAWQPAQKALPAPKRPHEPVQDALRIKIVHEDIQEARLALAWHGPALQHTDVPAFDALATLLGGGDASRLHESLRRRLGWVNDVYAYAYTPRDPGLLMVGAELPAEHVKSTIAEILRQVVLLQERPVSAAELARVNMILQSAAAYQRETVQGQSQKLGFFEVVAGDYHFEQRYLQALTDLTPADLQDVAKRYVHPLPTVILHLPKAAEGICTVEDVQAMVSQAFSPRLSVGKRVQHANDTTRVELDNGAVLLLRPENKPIVAMRAVALGGQRWESANQAGLSHLFAEVWGLATNTMDATTLAHHSALLGGQVGAFAGRNSVGLRASFVAGKALLGLELLADILLNPKWDETLLLQEREVLLQHIAAREDNPGAVAFELFAKTLYPNHRYGLPSEGTPQTLQTITVADLQQYHQTFLSPDKLVIAITGGIDVEATIAALSRDLAGQSSSVLPRLNSVDFAIRAPRYAKYDLQRQQAHVIVGAMGVTLHQPQRFALEVLSTILSGQSGRLFLDLRDEQSLAYSVSSMHTEGLDPGAFLIHMGTSPQKVPQALAGVYKHLQKLRDEQVTTDELQRAKRYLVGSHAISLQHCAARAMSMALNERYGLGYDEYTRYNQAIEQVTTLDIQHFAQQYLQPEQLVEVMVGA